MCFSTDQKCLNFLSLVLPGSIDARLVLNQSNLFFDWLNPIFDQSKFLKFLKESYCLARLVPDRYSTDRISNEKNKRSLPSHVLQFFFKTFLSPFVFLCLDQSKTQAFWLFLPPIFKGFCPQALVRPLYPSFFNLITCFMHFSLKILNIGNLGFTILGCF